MICDFCSSPEVRWEHRCKPFHVSEAALDDDGRFAVCDPCHEIIVRGDEDGLLDRSVNNDPDPTGTINGLRRRIAMMHQFFWKGYESYGELPPEEIQAEHRLVRFHREINHFQAECVCGWKGQETQDYEAARDEFAAHSGGNRWSSLP